MCSNLWLRTKFTIWAVGNPNIYLHLQNESKVGDEFMRQIEAVAAYVPYMTCEGNHEQA